MHRLFPHPHCTLSLRDALLLTLLHLLHIPSSCNRHLWSPPPLFPSCCFPFPPSSFVPSPIRPSSSFSFLQRVPFCSLFPPLSFSVKKINQKNQSKQGRGSRPALLPEHGCSPISVSHKLDARGNLPESLANPDAWAVAQPC